jgi:hypothetical protein
VGFVWLAGNFASNNNNNNKNEKKKPINNQTAHFKHSSKKRNNNSDRSEKLSELPLHSFIMKSLLHSVVAVVAVVVA